MSQHRVLGRYYQLAGKVREWLGEKQGNEAAIEAGRRDQLVGRIAQHVGVTLIEADRLADAVPAYQQDAMEN
jgi:uncharacterized protein YjbJ (UPF0337 family)